jgi:3-dehydroquinate synthase
MRLTISTASKRYPVIIEANILKRYPWPKDAVVLCDERLLTEVKKRFKQQTIIVVPNGERQKTLATVEWVCDQMAQLHCDRQVSIIAVGGGVLGDIAGLVASLFMRGVKLYHVPTTLLAMVDSSIGGKNGVDLPSGKNLVGTILQPEAVIMDPTWLVSLPEAEFCNGMGEVVKHGVLDKDLFVWLERNAKKIKQRQLTTLQQLIVRNVQVKAAIVAADEREADQRMLLNLGHTFAHAFELLSDYTIPHGQAVAIGLAYVSAMSNLLERSRVLALLNEFKLPTSLSKPFPSKAIVQAMLTDKKHSGNTLTLVIPEALGEVHIHRQRPTTEMIKFLERYHAVTG